MNNSVCQRCGKCCLNCRYLVKLPNGRTLCRIYKKRVKDRWNPLIIGEIVCVKIGTYGTYCRSEKKAS